MKPLHDLVALFREIGFAGLVDMTLVSLFVYSLLVFFKKTKSGFVLTGILIVSVIYLWARFFNLHLVSFMLQGFFAVILVAVVVIFQEELRHYFEQVAVWSLERKPGMRKRHGTVTRRDVEILVRAAFDLGRQKIGALIVLRGRDALDRPLTGGIELGGLLSEPIVKSIFEPNSPGHDGAVLIEGGKLQRFACHLPLSKNLSKLKTGGTRHAAALGLAELSDALCLVVSEERGTVSVAQNGDLKEIAEPGKLAGILGDFYREVEPKAQTRKPWHEFFKSNYKEKVLALFVTFALWFVFVHESVVVYRTYEVPVFPSAVAEPYELVDFKPRRLRVTFAGPRRAFYFIDANNMRAQLKLFNADKAVKSQTVAASDLTFPAGIHVEKISPATVHVKLEAKKAKPAS